MSLENSSIGFIGAGNMANALIRGLLAQGVAGTQLLAADIDSDKLQKLKDDCDIQVANSKEIAAIADVVVLAVKPQVMKDACRQIQPALEARNCLIVSIAAGITCQHLQSWLGTQVALVRCMPNTPALIGHGITGERRLCALRSPDRARTPGSRSRRRPPLVGDDPPRSISRVA